MEGRIFASAEAPDSPRVAHYSHVIYPIVPGIPVHLSGIVGKDIGTGKLVEGGAGPEAECILGEVERQLANIGLKLRHVMSVIVFLAGPVGDSDNPSPDFAAMNAVYKKIFGENNPPPTRATIGGCQLLDGARVEMVVTAWKPNSD
ncbi:MAG: RidA family protein [Candidatus Gracilibacteria bacterium]|jgi:2-iminobutanoate/2-iminopropanoate deaminase